MRNLINLWDKYVQLSTKPSIISFTSGRPDTDVYNYSLNDIAGIVYEISDDYATYDYSPAEGLFELRQNISNFYLLENLYVSPKNILITHGAQQAIDLIFRTCLRKNEIVLMENRNYLNLEIPILNRGGIIKTLEKPLNSYNLNELENIIKKNQPKIFYLIPDFANPTGETLTLEIRHNLADLAKKYHFLIAEDQTYRYLAYHEDDQLPSLKALASQYTIIIGTISKIIVPGLRIGWLVIPQKLFPEFLEQKKAADLLTSTLDQLIVARLFNDQKWLKNHLKNIKAYYQNKMALLLNSLTRYLPDEFLWNKPVGGFFVWISGSKNFNAQKLFYKALKNGVSFMPGSIFYYQKPEKNTFRLSISGIGKNQIKEGVKRLAATIGGEKLMIKNQEFTFFNILDRLLHQRLRFVR